jgi:hypothetical protein
MPDACSPARIAEHHRQHQEVVCDCERRRAIDSPDAPSVAVAWTPDVDVRGPTRDTDRDPCPVRHITRSPWGTKTWRSGRLTAGARSRLVRGWPWPAGDLHPRAIFAGFGLDRTSGWNPDRGSRQSNGPTTPILSPQEPERALEQDSAHSPAGTAARPRPAPPVPGPGLRSPRSGSPPAGR